jgi:hypothetical protein
VLSVDLFLRAPIMQKTPSNQAAVAQSVESHNIQHCVEEIRLSLGQMRSAMMDCGAKIEDLSSKWGDTFGNLEASCKMWGHPQCAHRNRLHCMVCMEPFPNDNDEENYIVALGCGN